MNNRSGCPGQSQRWPAVWCAMQSVCMCHFHLQSNGWQPVIEGYKLYCLLALPATCLHEFFFYSAPRVFASANFFIHCFPFLSVALTLENMLLRIRFLFMMLRFFCWSSLSCLFPSSPSTSNCTSSTLAMVEQVGRPQIKYCSLDLLSEIMHKTHVNQVSNLAYGAVKQGTIWESSFVLMRTHITA